MEILEIKPPEILSQTSAKVNKLFVIGNLELLKEKTLVAVVGSRRASEYGLRNARKISKLLAEKEVVIVSGLALGIDAEAHRGALEAKGKTIAVLGSAINHFHPITNEQLAKNILKNDGLIISEYPKDSPTFPTNFVCRNRIIAGLSVATIVIEAQEKSGALITANLAAEYNRLVYALPGDVDRLNSRGTNLLISQGATCLASAEILFEDLGLFENSPQLKLDLNDKEKEIINILDQSEESFDKIIAKTNMKAPELLTALTSLELQGVVRKNEDGAYLLT